MTEKSLLAQCLINGLAILTVYVAENIFAKPLDETYYVPALVLGYVFLDILHYPAKNLVLHVQVLYELVYSLFLYLLVVKPYA